MRQPFVAGNWKMHGDRAFGAALIDGVIGGLDKARGTRVAVCPPFPLIPDMVSRIAGAPVEVGGQNLSEHDEGAHTGEVSGAMLVDAGCSWCIVGHSERRARYGETSELVALKFQTAQRSGLIPILCVGETLEEREGDRTETIIAGQLDAVVGLTGADKLAEAVIAYEPVWAIGTGRTATPEQAQQVHLYIRERVASAGGPAEGLRIIYGGSVKPGNAEDLFAQPDIDGGLIGGASLNADDFLAICAACSND